jgi:hypothetical protein
MSELLEQLEAAINETERIARATGTRGYPAEENAWNPGDFTWALGLDHAGFPDDDDLEHIAHNDPKRVLRRVARDRKLLALHVLTVSKHEQFPYDPVSGERIPDSWDVECACCGWCGSDPTSGCPTVLVLAEDYEIEVES